MILFRIGVELLELDLFFGHLRELKNVIHHFIFEDRRSQFPQHLGVVAVEVVDLPLLSRELLDALEQRLVHFLVGRGDVVARTDFRKKQAKPDAPR